MTPPPVLILMATGTNRDGDAAHAIEAAGGKATTLHVNELRERPARLHEAAMLVLPGGFSYGDALGAGRLLATDLRWLFQDELVTFVAAERAHHRDAMADQALVVKSGWLCPALPMATRARPSTRNASNRFGVGGSGWRPTPTTPASSRAG